MAPARFSLHDSQGKVWFFEETFLLANISMEMVLEIPFLSLSNADVKFMELRKLIWRFYTAAEALPITSWFELIDKSEFAKLTMNKYSETFVVHVTAIKLPTAMLIHLSRAFQVLDDPTLSTL